MIKFTRMEVTILLVAMNAVLAGCGESDKGTADKKGDAASAATLTVGGTVSGLAGSGLVLQLNGAGDLAVNASGKFKFPKPLTKGSAYTVSVKDTPTAPVKQICTVSQGTGSISASAVANVAVNCEAKKFAIGVTVSGLSGKGLVLQLNGANDLVLAKSGDSVFPNIRLADGSDYNVAIKTMPPAQRCKIKAINFAPDDETLNIAAVTCTKKGKGK